MEKVLYVKIRNSKELSEEKLFVNFLPNKVQTALSYKGKILEESSINFNYCLLEILAKLEEDFIILFSETAEAIDGGKEKQIIFNVEVQRVFNQIGDYFTLGFTLKCDLNGRKYEQYAEEDFSIALKKLLNSMNIKLNACFSCAYADFRSDGSEELLNDWYCFRNIGIPQMDTWYNEPEKFMQAIPHLSAFHWCPKFKRRDRPII